MTNNTVKSNSNLFNWVFLLIAAGILASSMIYIWTELVQSNKDNQQTSQWITNTVSVIWEWKSYVVPDTLIINATVSELADTTKEAQEMANKKIAQLHKILAEQDIDKENIKTNRLNVYPEYDWKEDWKKLRGYKSQQSLTIEIEWKKQIDKGNVIIDAISEIGAVNINNTRFELKDKNAWYLEARENAFEDAKAKAEQLAKLGWVSLGKPIMITDSNVRYNWWPVYYAESKMVSMDMAGEQEVMPTPELSPWETEVSINISVVYEIY